MPRMGMLFITVIFFAIQTPAIGTVSSKVNSSSFVNNSFTSIEQPLGLTVKKWQVGRVSRKHYEIVNMLWRKTKIFVDPETTTPIDNRFRRSHVTATLMAKYKNFKPLSSARPVFQSLTPSFIEFYYLDDNDDRIKRRDSLIPLQATTQSQRNLPHNSLIRSPVLSFRVDEQVHLSHLKKNTPINKETSKPSPQFRKRQKSSIYGLLSNTFKKDMSSMVKSNTFMPNPYLKHTIITEKYLDNETCPATFESETPLDSTTYKNTALDTFKTNTTQDEITPTTYEGIITSYEIGPTTAYDKIKFFEMFDQYTVIPDSNNNKYDFDDMIRQNEIDGNLKVNLEDVDHNTGNHDGTKVKNVKKHVDEILYSTHDSNNNKKSEKKLKFKAVMFNVSKTDSKKKSIEIVTTDKSPTKPQNNTWEYLKNSSRVAALAEYPFAAVYIYEPSQIHCDAAALSPHWLIAAGSCLSRFHRKDGHASDLQGRSAFVAYCGQKWWHPERVSYVKYSIVHPNFHPKDNTRRSIYNIGLIQVVGSMSSCFGWAPITLMSHNFAASDGSIATAVGWGLDRYDVRYTSGDLPKNPLTAYNGLLFSNSCPGRKGLGKAKLYNDQSSTLKSNLYCLSLPPYSGEENDPIHGSLLLVGGKLIALYLQEERRAWGQQTAQYTGVWRLVPWVHEVAREPYEGDAFALDIDDDDLFSLHCCAEILTSLNKYNKRKQDVSYNEKVS